MGGVGRFRQYVNYLVGCHINGSWTEQPGDNELLPITCRRRALRSPGVTRRRY